MSIVLMPEALRTKLGEQAAKELVDLINSTSRTERESILETSSNCFEKRLSEVTIEINTSKSDLKAEISSVKAELIKWMFLFWLGQIAVITGILFYLK